MTGEATPAEILAFWREAGRDRWYRQDGAFDDEVRHRFLGLWHEAAAGKLSSWEASDDGALALTIVLDQFPRNMFRGDRTTYKTDPAALLAADRAIERGYDRQVDPQLRAFFYLPFMHSENLSDQQRSVRLNEELSAPESIKFAHHHRDIVAKFGRFPHRNAILGRESTPDEIAFLEQSDFRG